MFPLFSLPNELVDLIVEAIGDRPTLIALAQTCQKLHPLAEAQLFRNIKIRDGPTAARFAVILAKRRERFHMVEKLEATPTQYIWRGIERMPDLVGQMKKLKSLKVESPLINTFRHEAWWPEGSVREYMDVFEAANGVRTIPGTEEAFRCLTSFTLHSHGDGSRYYQIDTILPIFLSPTLKYIHLSCVSFGTSEPFPDLHAYIGRTPLETLILERCTIQTQQYGHLHVILSLPRALLSAALLLDHHLGAYPGDDQGLELLKAIQQQSNSLEYLRYAHDTRTMRRYTLENVLKGLQSSSATLRHNSTSLSAFKRLRNLDLDYRSNITGILLDTNLAPPALDTLGLTGFDYKYDMTWRHITSYISAIASETSFSHLRLHTKPNRHDFDEVFNIFTSPDCTQTLHRVALLATVDVLKRKASVQLICAEQRGSCFPPFLYREKMPKERVMFDSRKLFNEGKVDGEDRRFDMEAYIPARGSSWAGPFFGIGTTRC